MTVSRAIQRSDGSQSLLWTIVRIPKANWLRCFVTSELKELTLQLGEIPLRVARLPPHLLGCSITSELRELTLQLGEMPLCVARLPPHLLGCSITSELRELTLRLGEIPLRVAELSRYLPTAGVLHPIKYERRSLHVP